MSPVFEFADTPSEYNHIFASVHNLRAALHSLTSTALFTG